MLMMMMMMMMRWKWKDKANSMWRIIEKIERQRRNKRRKLSRAIVRKRKMMTAMTEGEEETEAVDMEVVKGAAWIAMSEAITGMTQHFFGQYIPIKHLHANTLMYAVALSISISISNICSYSSIWLQTFADSFLPWKLDLDCTWIWNIHTFIYIFIFTFSIVRRNRGGGSAGRGGRGGGRGDGKGYVKNRCVKSS